jgi:YVTN family beta-propeller protein
VVAKVLAGGGPDTPQGVAITPDGKYVYVTNDYSGTFYVIATASNTVVATAAVGVGPEGVAISPDGAYAIVANAGSYRFHS